MRHKKQRSIAEVRDYLASRPGLSVNHAAKNLGVASADVRKAGQAVGYEFAPRVQPAAAKGGGGMPIGGKRVALRKPAESAKNHLLKLPKDRAYPVEELSERLCLSTETIRKHAKELDAIRYVEQAPGEWVPCILNPETAKKYGCEI